MPVFAITVETAWQDINTAPIACEMNLPAGSSVSVMELPVVPVLIAAVVVGAAIKDDVRNLSIVRVVYSPESEPVVVASLVVISRTAEFELVGAIGRADSAVDVAIGNT